ncbi:MAG TPA: PLP-dependent aminotransferase family protein [Terriglobia bacterium]|jgi:DNA-binding transcriptional MocR family regulator
MKSMQALKPPLYLKVARQIEQQIRKGALQAGDRVPSIRGLRRQQGVSVSTVLQAYFWLENQGWIEPRPQSGFYVRVPYAELVPEPEFQPKAGVPTDVGVSGVLDEVVKCLGDHTMVPLGAASPNPSLYPNARLNKIINRIARNNPTHSARYELATGLEPLRRQIARRATGFGCTFSPNDVIITCGGMEALNLAMRAVARPGEVLAIESPTYFGILHIIESLGMKAIEIPTHPRTGMDLDALSRAIRKHSVRACVTIANGHNPLGFILDDEYKKNLVALLTRHNVPLIEDDIYGDLAFNGTRPKTAKAFDSEGLVLLCSSFSKVLAPGFRIGWIEGGRYRDEVRRLKFINTLGSPSLPQLAIAEFIDSGGYDRYLRSLRQTLAQQVQRHSQAAARYFPEGTKISRPAAGHVLWVELPPAIDSWKLFRAAASQKISIVPGMTFSPTQRFGNHIRLSCGHPLNDSMERAIATLGKLCDKQM